MQVGFSYLHALLFKRKENSLEDFYINRYGKKLYSMFFENYTENLWGRHPREIAPDWGAQRAKGLSIAAIVKDIFSKMIPGRRNRAVETSLIEEFSYPKLGPGQLWDVTADEIRKMGGTILTGCLVTGLHKDANDHITSLTYRRDGREITVEAGRPDTITAEKLAVLKAHGVHRVSVNPQTMKQETLDLIGRRHTVEQVEEAFHLARKTGFDNINMDIILGLPGETAADVAHTIEAVKMLSPDALTVHSLAVKRASKLGKWIEEHGATAYNNTEEIMEIASRGAAALDMVPYYLYRQKNMSGNFENVGYSRQGKYGIYNILINEEKQTIAALGAGSITKGVFSDDRIERCENVKDVSQYIERIGEMIERKRVLLED